MARPGEVQGGWRSYIPSGQRDMMDRTLLMPAPRDESYNMLYDQHNRRKDLNVYTSEYHLQTKAGHGPLLKRREALHGYTGCLKLKLPPPVELRGVDCVSNEQKFNKLAEEYGNPHIVAPYGVYDNKISHPARRPNATVDVLQQQREEQYRPPLEERSVARDLADRISAEGYGRGGEGYGPPLSASRSAPALAAAGAGIMQDRRARGPPGSDNRPVARPPDGLYPGEYGRLMAKFGIPAGKGDMGGVMADLNKLCGRKGPQEGDPNISNLHAL